MKTLKTTLLCCLFTIVATAQNIITIDNSPESTTTHQTLQDALDAAVAGDIIYVQPTATAYGAGTIDKPITIVGRSHSEDNRNSIVNSIVVRASNVTIKGLKIDFISTNPDGPTATPYVGLRVYECEVINIGLGSSASVNAISYINDVIIQGSHFGNFNQANDATDILISNNIIKGSFTTRAPTTLVISNNIFRSGGGSITLNNASTTATAIFFNNMFKTNSDNDQSILLNTGDFNFSNCLTYNYGLGNLDFETNSGATFLENNSLLNTNPLFIDVDSASVFSLAGNNNNYRPESREDNLMLQAGSPALTGGSNNDEIGLFNSGFRYNYLGNPRDVPILDIINYDAAVPKNGTINVTIQAKAN